MTEELTEKIPTDVRLQFIAACNPYRRHSEAMINKLTSAGLGILRNRSQARQNNSENSFERSGV